MLYEIKRIPAGPVLKVSFFIFLIVGFIIGLFYGMLIINLIAGLGGLLNGEEEVFSDFAGLGMLGIIMMGVIMSLFSSVILTAVTGLSVVTYNVFAGMLGGIKVELEEAQVMMPRYTAPQQGYENPPHQIDPPHYEERDEQ